MSVVVNSKKSLTDETFQKGKFYKIHTFDNREMNGRVVEQELNKVMILENGKITHTILKNEIVEVKKISTLKSILLPTVIIAAASTLFITVFKGDEGLHKP